MEIKKFTSVEEMEAVSEVLSNLAKERFAETWAIVNRHRNRNVNSEMEAFAADLLDGPLPHHPKSTERNLRCGRRCNCGT
jgi:hypothetical protein